MFYSYIIKSLTLGKWYYGHAVDLDRRLHEHNTGRTTSTKNEALVYCRITVGTQRVEFSLKKKVRKVIWNNGQAKANTEEGRAVNAYLKQTEVCESRTGMPDQ
jgi:predicted GIY-YIG superfamily endonuclease